MKPGWNILLYNAIIMRNKKIKLSNTQDTLKTKINYSTSRISIDISMLTRLKGDIFIWKDSQAQGSESVKVDLLTLIKQIKEF